MKIHIWERAEYSMKAFDLLQRYGVLLRKKHHRHKKAKMLRQIKEFAKEISE